MAAEKVVKDLVDLREAAAQAAKDGVCRIRLASGESLLLYPAETSPQVEQIHDVTDADERKAVLSCLDPSGRTYSAAEAREELKRRLASKGISRADETR